VTCFSRINTNLEPISPPVLRSPLSLHLSLPERALAAALSGIVKNVVDAGHAFYWLRRGRLGMLCRRFDWFAGLNEGVVVGETYNSVWRCFWWGMALYTLY